MSSTVVDVGDTFTVTYAAASGTTVRMDWLDPDLQPVLDQVLVPASGSDPARFPQTLTATRTGMWTARFFDPSGTTDYFVRAESTQGRPPPLAAIDDVGIRYGDLDADQVELTAYLLKAASGKVRQRFPLIDEYLAAGRLDPGVVATTVAGMVLRVLWNPEGLRAETTGPFSRSFDTSTAAGMLVITPDDAGDFVPPVQSAGSRRLPAAGTIMAVPGMVPPPSRGFGYGPW